jgi:hypothetical protein
MQSFYDSSGDARRPFFLGCAIFGMLLEIFSTAVLYGHPSSAVAPPPAAPSSLKATAISSAHIDLTWTDNSNDEAGFKIEIKFEGSGVFTQIATVGANVTSYSSMGLQTNTEYFYRVRAYSAGGNSAYSNEAGATTLPDIPAAPTNLTATTESNNQINLAWTDNSSDETGFKIERKASTATAYTPVTTVGPNVTNFANTGLVPNTVYSYRVLAYNSGGESNYSNTAEAKTLPNLPMSPSSLTATAVSANQIKLAWADNAGNELGFKIERKNGATGIYKQIATVGINVKSYSNTGLSPNTNYFFRVRAYNAGGDSDYSNEANARTLPLPPAAPSNLTAATAGSNKIALAWADNANNETGFKIERKTGAAAYAQIAVVGANVKNFTDVNLAATAKYFYRVRAYNAGGHSAFSNEASATTLPNPPTAPNNLAASAGPRLIKLVWMDNADNESGFKIERKKLATGTYTQIATIGANKTGFVDSSLSGNTEYFYRVRAYNAGGHSGYSNEANATALPSPPAPPGNLAATAVSNSRIDLTWTDNAGNELGFRIERKTGAAGIYAQIATVGINVKNYSNTGLSPNTNYFYRVRAYNAGGHSGYSNEANAQTLSPAPAPPGNLTAATAGSNKIALVWADNADNENGFKIERKTGAAGTYALIATIGANKTGFVDSSLIANTQYFYRVRAYNAGGHSGYSNEANATTLPNPPAPPGSLTATAVSESRIDLAWTDNAGDEGGFKIERKTSAAGAYAEIATVGANVTGYSNTGLAANAQYFYRIRAYNTGGHSAYSNEASAIPFSSVNLALNKPATASSTDSSSTPSRAVDGALSTYWRSGFINSTAPVAWLRVQLSTSSPVPVGRAVVRWYENYFAIEYELQVSNDGASWTTVYADSAGAAGTQDFSFAQTTAQFVRLYMKQHEKSNYRIIDLEVYANPGAAKRWDSVADAAIIPDAIALAQNYPNPFNPTTQIGYELPMAGQVSLIIYNSLGQEVRRLIDKQQAAGYHQVTWNGRDQNGKPVPSGVYHYRLQVEDPANGASFVATKKMLMAK